MPPLLSIRAQHLPRSPIRRIFNAAQALKESGIDVIRLDIGDPDFEMPRRIGEAVQEALQQGKTHYSPTPGITPLRRAVARHLERRFGISCPWQRVAVHQGATQALNAALLAVCDAGSSILLPEIYFPNYLQQCVLAGVHPRFYPLDDRFQPRFEALEECWDESVRAILINSPSNPTGALFPPSTVRRLYDFARRKGIWILSDEAYIDYVFNGEHLPPLAIDWEQPESERRVLGIFSFSKSYAVTGLRMGWTVTPDSDTAAHLGTINEPLTGSLTTPLQWGMIAALERDDTAERRQQIQSRCADAAQTLSQSGLPIHPPSGGIFFFFDVSSTGLDGDAFADRLLEEERVAVVPGSGFCLTACRQDGRLAFHPSPRGARCIRLSVGVPEERLQEGLRRLVRFVNKGRGVTTKDTKVTKQET